MNLIVKNFFRDSHFQFHSLSFECYLWISISLFVYHISDIRFSWETTGWPSPFLKKNGWSLKRCTSNQSHFCFANLRSEVHRFAKKWSWSPCRKWVMQMISFLLLLEKWCTYVNQENFYKKRRLHLVKMIFLISSCKCTAVSNSFTLLSSNTNKSEKQTFSRNTHLNLSHLSWYPQRLTLLLGQ